MVAAGVLALASLLQFAVAVPYLGAGGLGSALHASRWPDVARTDLGRWLLARAVLSALFLGSLVKVGRWRAGRSTGLVIAGVLFAGLTVTVVGDGHAAAGRWLVLGWLATSVHIVAMCCWLAGLAVLALGMRRNDHNLLGAVRRRWSRTAAWAVAAIVVSGVVQAWRLLPDAHLLSSSYGRLLIAKTVLVAAMLLLGNLGRRMLVRSVGDEWPSALRRSVAVELVVGLAVIVVTTVLVQTEPGTRPSSAAAAAPSTASTPPSGTEWSRTLRLGARSMTVTLDGTTTGRHRMTLVADDAAQPFADPVSLDARLTLAAKGLGPIPVLFGEDSRLHWSTDALELPVAGQWRLELFVIDPSTKARFATTLDITDAGAP
jgi:copper transport protein